MQGGVALLVLQAFTPITCYSLAGVKCSPVFLQQCCRHWHTGAVLREGPSDVETPG